MKKGLLFFILSLSVIFYSCKPDVDGPPSDVLSSFFNALSKNNISTAKMLSTKESATMIDLMSLVIKSNSAKFNERNSNFKIQEVSIKNDWALVPVKDKSSGHLTNYKLKKIEGQWKVVFDQTSGYILPSEILSTFFDLLDEKDIINAKKFSTEESANMLDLVALVIKSNPDQFIWKFGKENIEIGKMSIAGDMAIIPVNEKLSGELKSYYLKLIDGTWKVVFDNTSIFISPPEIISTFFDALSEKNFDAAKKLSTEESSSMIDMMIMSMKSDTTTEDNKYKRENMEFGEARIEGNMATVPVKEKVSGEVVNYKLKMEYQQWKVAFDKASLMSIGMDKMKEEGVDPDQQREEAMKELNNIDMDSMKKAMQESMPPNGRMH